MARKLFWLCKMLTCGEKMSEANVSARALFGGVHNRSQSMLDTVPANGNASFEI